MSRPLRVMIDARMLIGRFGGVNRFVTRLVDELAKLQDVHVAVLCGEEIYPPWADRRDIEVVVSSFHRCDRTAARRLWWEERCLPEYIRRAGVDLFHATWNTGIPARCPVPSVLTIHDLIPWHGAAGVSRLDWQGRCYRHAIRAAVKRASWVTTVSGYVRDDVIATLKIDPTKVATVPNGVDVPPIDGAGDRRTTPAYALYVGGHEPRKNLPAVFAAVNCYRQRFGPHLELRLTGHPATLSDDAKQLCVRLQDQGCIRFLGEISDGELGEQYASAGVLLILSHDEGFGLPVLEAMAYGCPVVAASNASLPEVVGDAGLLVKARNPDEVANAMHVVLTKPERRAELIRRGRLRAESSTWSSVAARMHRGYQAITSHNGRFVPASVGGAAGAAV